MGIVKRWKAKILVWLFIFLAGATIYYEWWGKHLYIVTAYCDCPVCINVPEFRDGKFANGEKVSWGGIAASKEVPFGTEVELVRAWPLEFWKVYSILRNRTEFTVKDRGGKIRGRHIDLFIPDSMGGHKAALRWGRQMMRVKIDGKLAD